MYKRSIIIKTVLLAITFSILICLPANAAATKRIYGTDRYSMAAKISADGWEYSDYAVIATGEDFPDALSIAAIAGNKKIPILLVSKD